MHSMKTVWPIVSRFLPLLRVAALALTAILLFDAVPLHAASGFEDAALWCASGAESGLSLSEPTAPETAPAKTRRLPFLAEEAHKRGIELPRTYGVGLVYYYLDRAIDISDVRVGRNGASPESVSDFAQLGSSSRVNNANVKVDMWILPFLNLYAIAGYIWNQSTTNIDVTLPPLTPGGSPRQFRMSVPTELEGTVGGLGMTLAGGYGPYFVAFDVNSARADLGFDDRFKALVTSLRAGWNGKVGSRPLQAWLNATYWNTFAEATGRVADPDGGTLDFEVDQGPAHPYTYGAGFSCTARDWLTVSLDSGVDFHGGWYVALVPVYRF